MSTKIISTLLDAHSGSKIIFSVTWFDMIKSENGYIESFNGKMRYELLNQEIFDTVLEARIVIEKWRHEYNTIRPHSSLGTATCF